MKVALLSPFIHPICEPFSGGTEAFIFHFAQQLAQQGIEVICYACEGSAIPGVKIRHCGVARSFLAYPRAIEELNGAEILAIQAVEDSTFYQAFAEIRSDSSFDLVHNHSFSGIPFFLAPFFPRPIVHTLHLPPMLPAMVEGTRFASRHKAQTTVVAVSHAQAHMWQPYYAPERVIYNGPSQAIEAFAGKAEKHKETLIFVGRIDPNKGLEDAIAVAVALGKPLKIYGTPQPSNTTYFTTCIVPLIEAHPNVTYYGAVSQEVLFQELRQSQALLLPVKWEEPFSTVVLEAISLGTPAVMYDRGSARELITTGITGYVVPADDLEAFAQAVKRTETLDRSTCQACARRQFSLETCARAYIQLFHSLSSEGQRLSTQAD